MENENKLKQISLEELINKKDSSGKTFEITKSIGPFLIKIDKHYIPPFKSYSEIIEEFIYALTREEILKRSDINAYSFGECKCIQDGEVIGYHPIQFFQIKKE